MRLLDLTGRKYGRLTVLGRAPNGGRHARWNCKCDCGETSVVFGDALRRGLTRSCTCLRTERTSERSLKHGHSRGRRSWQGRGSREYRAWQHAIERCENPKSARYESYGGRGIRVAPSWRADFKAFLRDMGPCPASRTLERIDVNGHYEPGNCRWATWHEQRRNRTDNRYIEFRGRRKILADWARDFGVGTGRLHGLLKSRSIDQAAAHLGVYSR